MGEISESDNTRFTLQMAESLKQALLGLGSTFIKGLSSHLPLFNILILHCDFSPACSFFTCFNCLMDQVGKALHQAWWCKVLILPLNYQVYSSTFELNIRSFWHWISKLTCDRQGWTALLWFWSLIFGNLTLIAVAQSLSARPDLIGTETAKVVTVCLMSFPSLNCNDKCNTLVSCSVRPSRRTGSPVWYIEGLLLRS